LDQPPESYTDPPLSASAVSGSHQQSSLGEICTGSFVAGLDFDGTFEIRQRRLWTPPRQETGAKMSIEIKVTRK
jgi:hypothetical protein